MLNVELYEISVKELAKPRDDQRKETYKDGEYLLEKLMLVRKF